VTDRRTDTLDFNTGAGVLVHNRFDGRWVAGFEIADIRSNGDAAPPVYRLRRRSDAVVLPADFAPAQLRREP
jgi:hypothetical protein